MLEIIRSTFPIRRKLFIFSDEPSLEAGLFTSYHQCLSTQDKAGFKRYPFFTKLITISDPDFDQAFSRNARYGIRKAKSEGLYCTAFTDFSTFVSIYNRFVEHKKLDRPLTVKELKAYGDNLVLRAACSLDGSILTVHSYICDPSIARVRAFHSASRMHDPTISREQRSVIGRANIFLHASDMLHFREQGYATYDLGGYTVGTHDEALAGINKFKDNFGGTLVEESAYVPYWIHWFRALRDRSHRLFRRPHKRTH